MTICICAWRDLDHHVAGLSASHVVSLLGVEGHADTPPGILPENHLQLDIDDIAYEMEGYNTPQPQDVARLLTFGENWGVSGPMVVHCYAGISRSSAAALILLCQQHPGREAEAANLLRSCSPHVNPNRLIIEFADREMGCKGRLVDAVADMVPADFVIPAPATMLPSRLD